MNEPQPAFCNVTRFGWAWAREHLPFLAAYTASRHWHWAWYRRARRRP